MLTILPNSKIEFEGQEIKLGNSSLPSFILSNLSESVQIEKGVTVMDLLHFFFFIKDFVKDYCVEDYFSVNAIFSSIEIPFENQVNAIRGYKELVLSDENELHQPIISEFIMVEKLPVAKFFRELEVVLDTDISLKDYNGTVLKDGMKRHFTLLDLVSFFFEELYYIVLNNSSTTNLTGK